MLADKGVLIVLDDRERASPEVKPFIGMRRYGDIIYRRKKLSDYFFQSLPEWAIHNLHCLRDKQDLANLRHTIENVDKDISLFIISSRAGVSDSDKLHQLIERLPYAEDDFTDKRHKPLIVFFKSSNWLLENWSSFLSGPLHFLENPWKDMRKLTALSVLDLAKIRDFLSFTCGSTETRHFNKVKIDTYYYTKSSADKDKMRAEYDFYDIVPEKMRPWLIQPFDFQETDSEASYKMMRYYLADAALQWVHGAFDLDTFESFIERILFFLSERPTKPCERSIATNIAGKLFVDKVDARIRQLLSTDEGKKINALAASADPELEINNQVERYKRLFDAHQNEFATDHLAVGHGDPCFSNILYDQQRHLLKLIDPKGASQEKDLWTHPLYDLCKISHSVLGDYDFINNGLYDISLNDNNKPLLKINSNDLGALKGLFLQKLLEHGLDWKIVRLGEASLFLSMLPLHIDYPNKVTAFILTAKKILDEVENG